MSVARWLRLPGSAVSRPCRPAWRKTVAMAQLTKQSVEIVVEYEAPSEYAGRKLRLYYDPAADSDGHEWLD